MTQESRSEEDDDLYKHLLTTTHDAYHNQNPDSNMSGGTIIYVSKEFGCHFKMVPVNIIPGYVQVLKFIPKDCRDTPFISPFIVLNIYLRSSNAPAALSMLSGLREAIPDPPRFVFAGGDWILTDHREDYNAKGPLCLNTQAWAALTKTLDHFRLKEIYQPHHTRVSCHQGSSRLDRFYISHLLAEKCLMVPEVTLPTHPHMPSRVRATTFLSAYLSQIPP